MVMGLAMVTMMVVVVVVMMITVTSIASMFQLIAMRYDLL